MPLQHPSYFHPELTNDRLKQVAFWLLEEVFSTETDLQSEFDSRYTRGCTQFGRQQTKLTKLALRGDHNWLGVMNGGNDLVFTIGGIPCRFSSDDPDNPKKRAVLDANPFQTSFFDQVADGKPCKFCFVIDRGIHESAEPRVVLLGTDAAGGLLCRWESDTMRSLYPMATEAPAPAELKKPNIGVKRRPTDQDGEANSETGT